jgi:hypothetical protein
MHNLLHSLTDLASINWCTGCNEKEITPQHIVTGRDKGSEFVIDTIEDPTPWQERYNQFLLGDKTISVTSTKTFSPYIFIKNVKYINAYVLQQWHGLKRGRQTRHDRGGWDSATWNSWRGKGWVYPDQVETSKHILSIDVWGKILTRKPWFVFVTAPQ